MLTISIDDGHPLDSKLANIFDKIDVKATFFVPVKKNKSPILSKGEIRRLGKRFEIGGHTYNHVDLTKISPKEAWREIVEGKDALEDLLGKRVKSFAFPFGHYNSKVIEFVKRAGFEYCRSGRIVNFNEYSEGGFVRHPNLQLYPHKTITDLRHCLKYGDLKTFTVRALKYNTSHLKLTSIFESRPHAHFWCHSEDIERYDLWDFIKGLRRLSE